MATKISLTLTHIMTTLPLITPDWDFHHVFAFTTTRHALDGASQPPRESFNLAKHVGDDETSVSRNRDLLLRELKRRTQQGDLTLRWLNQTHSDILVDDVTWTQGVNADAVMTARAKHVCLVMTADCLPVVIVSEDGKRVAALHCGWRGLHQQLISKTLAKFDESEVKNVSVWLAPAISQTNYEVDTAFFERFVALSSEYRHAFTANRAGHYLCDLYEIARIELRQHGIETIIGGEHCTFSDERFYSHRQHLQTGRQVTGVVITD